ncbi:MAG: histidine--tRNA ligase [Chloroflexi bacterium]|nr:histidine--tRNA ligase [Chloroflexota bacterium]
MPRVKPQLLKGTRDLLPERMLLRHHVVGKLRAVFERFGFEPLETPALEYAETLEGKLGPEGDMLMYRFEDRGGRRVALRYDLTVPFARVVALYPELPRPFKRYQIAPVWRAESPQRGRYREFWQCDADVAGAASVLADAELVALTHAGFAALGFERYSIRVNHRRLLAALAEQAGVAHERTMVAFRALDKLAKIGHAAVCEEMVAGGVALAAAERLLASVAAIGPADGVLADLDRALDGHAAGRQAVAELRALFDGLAALGVPDGVAVVDCTMVRGLDYYTGPIYETTIEEPKIGSVSGGGRYDELIGMFAGQPVPATGVSFGLERVVDVLEALGKRPAEVGRTVTEALVTVFDAGTLVASLVTVAELRAAGLRAEVALDHRDLGRQLKYADRKGIPLAVLLGPDELAAGEALVKDLRLGEQTRVPRPQLVAHLRAALGAAGRALP